MKFVAVITVALSMLLLGQEINGQGQGQCRRRGRRLETVFISAPERQSAASTGSVRISGVVLAQNFDSWCFDLATRKYRTIDGTCNNPRNLGASHTPVARLLPAEYDDNTERPRQNGVDGNPLPSARLVSATVHPATNVFVNRPIMLMQWGQWLDHDLTSLPVASEVSGPVQCCGPDNTSPPLNSNRECFPIELPPTEDNFVGECMEFIRSVPATDKDGLEILPREQVNSLTAFVDASQVYGSTDELSQTLRITGGNRHLLRVKIVGGKEFLPENTEIEEDCIRRPGDFCFLAGDSRVNEQPGLGALHTIWLREHNRIARFLRNRRPNGDRDEIFELTRKIISALQQTITFNEWLPVVLGSDVDTWELRSTQGRSAYSPGIDPRIFNAFSSAAMRFGHSLIPVAFPVGNRQVPLPEAFNRPELVLDSFDDLVAGISGVRGSGSQPNNKGSQAGDRNFVEAITENLFQPPTGPPGRGLDLVALNIQRGRDHGIPRYTSWRTFCGLRNLTGFGDTEALGPFSSRLGLVYNSIEDIDLFTGAMHEPVDTGIVGPTFRCLLATQFFNLKFGDRHFFSTFDQLLGFTDAQLSALRRVRFSDVICANSDIDYLPRDVFSFPSGTNPLVPCRPNLSPASSTQQRNIPGPAAVDVDDSRGQLDLSVFA